MSKLIYQYILIFLLGTLGIWKAVPFGLLLKASPSAIFLMTATGSMAGVLILYFFGNQLKKLLYRVLASTVFWSFVLTFTGVYSIELFHELSAKVNFF